MWCHFRRDELAEPKWGDFYPENTTNIGRHSSRGRRRKKTGLQVQAMPGTNLCDPTLLLDQFLSFVHELVQSEQPDLQAFNFLNLVILGSFEAFFNPTLQWLVGFDIELKITSVNYFCNVKRFAKFPMLTLPVLDLCGTAPQPVPSYSDYPKRKESISKGINWQIFSGIRRTFELIHWSKEYSSDVARSADDDDASASPSTRAGSTGILDSNARSLSKLGKKIRFSRVHNISHTKSDQKVS